MPSRVLGNNLEVERAYDRAVRHYDPDATVASLESCLREMSKAASINFESSYWWMSMFLDALYLRTHDRRYLRRSMSWLQKSADSLDQNGLYTLGLRYLEGDGVRRDISRGVQYLIAAAEQGDEDAAAEAGHALLHEMPRSRPNVRRAISLLRQATEDGSAMGACALGWAYFTGTGVKRDRSKAVTLYRLAARRGSAEAMWNLALCYEDGEGVRKSPARSRFWYRKAAASGQKDAIAVLEELGISR